MKLTVHKKIQKGFTLIELLVVIAVLGVLAAVVAVAINPAEQLARGRDSGRKNTVGQLVNAMQSYYTAKGATYVGTATTWIDDLVSAGELKSTPPQTGWGGTATLCTNGAENGYCYYTPTAGEAVVYTRMESAAENSVKCGAKQAFFLWDSVSGRSGTYCNTGTNVTGSVATASFVTP